MESLIFIIAGFVTGIITGIIGASSIVAFIPIILLFLDYDAFSLIGISLALDVFISLVVFLMYKRFNHIKFKIGLFLAVFAVVGAIIGSYLSLSAPQGPLFAITGLVSIFTGIGIFRRKRHFKPMTKLNFDFSMKSINSWKSWLAVFLAFVIGLIAGGFGSAGGISLLLLLILLFRFEIHEAIGTSVFVMFFIAIAGSLTHFYYMKTFSLLLLSFAIIGGVIGAMFSSRLANFFKEGTLNKVSGLILIILGVATFLGELI